VESAEANDNGALAVPSIPFGNGILVAGNLVVDNQAERNFASRVAVSRNSNTIEDYAVRGQRHRRADRRSQVLEVEGGARSAVDEEVGPQVVPGPAG
jgi:hypothetical protein